MAVIKKQNSYMGLPMNIARGNPVPLDTTEIWYNLEDLKTYAKSGVTAYVGQIVQYVDETNKTSTAYIIANTDGELLEVGSATLGDNKSIELTDEGVLRLVGANTAEVGAQLVMGDNGTITWVKPDTTTVEGLNTAVTSLQTAVQGHETRLTNVEGDVSGLKSTLAGMGGIFNFVGSYTTDDLANLKAEDFDAGDVILIDGVKEYVCIEITNDDDTVTKRWEVLGDPSGVTALESKVSALEEWKADINPRFGNVESGLATAQGNITNLVNKDTELAQAIAGKASATELETVKNSVSTNTSAIAELEKADEAINTALATKATTTYVDSKIADVNTEVSKKADQAAVNETVALLATKAEVTEGLGTKVDTSVYNAKISSLETADSNMATEVAGVKATANQAASDIVTINASLANKAEKTVVEGLTTRVSDVETKASTNESNISTLSGTVSGLATSKADASTVTALTERVAANEKAISDHAVEYATLEGRMTTAEGGITKAQGDATQALSDASAANSAAAAAQGAAESAMAKANEVLGSADDTADKATVYGAKAAAAAAQSAADAAQGEVDALEEVVSNLDAAYKSADAALSSRIDAVEGVIGGVQGAMHFVGITTIDPAEGNTVAIEGKDDYTPVNGDVVIYKDSESNSIEYIYSDGHWVELGDVSAEAKRIAELDERLEVVETATAKIPTIEENISSLQSARADLEKRVKTLEDTSTSHASAISELETRMGTAEKSITDTAAAIRQELAAKAQELQKAVEDEAAARTSADANLQSQINTINGQLTWTKLTSV